VILPALLDFPEAEVAHAAGIPRRTINGLRGGRRPDHATLSRLVPALADLCVETTPEVDGRNPLAVLGAWRDRGSAWRVCPRAGSRHQASGSTVEPLVARPANRRRG
jgi:hypothetical protein